MRTLCARYLRQRRNRDAAKRRNKFEVGFVACFFYGFDRNKKKDCATVLFKGRFAVFCFVPPPFLRHGFVRAEELKRGGRLNLN